MNEYDNPDFFEKYAQMARSKKGLSGAGEWHQLKKLFPNFTDKRVLDLGCGYGWHCRYASQQGASSVLGIDVSTRMVKKAQEMTTEATIDYQVMKMEEIDQLGTFDCVISSLALHYVSSFEEIVKKVHSLLDEKGQFVFSVEHPVFTAEGTEDWLYDEQGEILAWPVDRYFEEGLRRTQFLGAEVVKYHKTLTTYLNSLLVNGFELIEVIEAQPDPAMLEIPGMKDELRRPMMLLVSAQKK
ncbi:hypothetical protein IGI37_001244 [Enterococcus sp. AZ194]|uniref:class I SAM-dependent methyltransferase n=1 Tax=Enterococcus sp. AZ194 TaxID=2774629 RepID=UPI003F26BB6E